MRALVSPTVCRSIGPLVRQSVGRSITHSQKLLKMALCRIRTHLFNFFSGVGYFLFFLLFLDASSHLYKRVCPSVGPERLFKMLRTHHWPIGLVNMRPRISMRGSVCPSVRPSLHPSVPPSVRRSRLFIFH